MSDDTPTADQHTGTPANRSVKRLRDPRALRALAHPTRLSLVGLLRVEGPLTATRAAELLGESSASMSFHLRQLAKYGMVKAGGGKGRERPWRATAMFTNLPEAAENPDLAVAADLLSSVIAERYFEDVIGWLEARGAEQANGGGRPRSVTRSCTSPRTSWPPWVSRPSRWWISPSTGG